MSGNDERSPARYFWLGKRSDLIGYGRLMRPVSRRFRHFAVAAVTGTAAEFAGQTSDHDPLLADFAIPGS
jgi:hypothetical protein